MQAGSNWHDAMMSKARKLYILESESASVVSLLRVERGKSDSAEAAEHLNELLHAFEEAAQDQSGTCTAHLRPLLATIKSPHTDAATTGRALSVVHTALVENAITREEAEYCSWTICEAATRARFTSRSRRQSHGDEIVLANIVLEALLCGKIGVYLSDQCIYEIFQATFRVRFEPKLSTVLRDNARSALAAMVRSLFSRLEHHEVQSTSASHKTAEINVASAELKNDEKAQTTDETTSQKDTVSDTPQSNEQPQTMNEVTSQRNTAGDGPQYNERAQTMDEATNEEDSQHSTTAEEGPQSDEQLTASESAASNSCSSDEQNEVRKTQPSSGQPLSSATMVEVPFGRSSNEAHADRPFAQSDEKVAKEGVSKRVRYTMRCVREVFRFSITLTTPLDNSNTESEQELGMYLIAVALETAGTHLARCNILLSLVENQLCRAVVAQLSDTNTSARVLAAALRLVHVLVQHLRVHLKLQHLLRIAQEMNAERVAMAVATIERLWRLPGVVRQLYVNYDCDIHSNDLLEDAVKTIADNCLASQTPCAAAEVREMCMNALATCLRSMHESVVQQQTREMPSIARNRGVVTRQQLLQSKQQKGIIVRACEIFSTEKPERGIALMQQYGLMSIPPTTEEIVNFLRNNRRLDKKRIAEYICNRKNSVVLSEFVRSFNFDGVRIDEALRLFLESFRLPGEAAQISAVMMHFAEHWHRVNNEPFASADAAFTLAYGIVMLNTDQHNPQVRRQQSPMTSACFKRNLAGCNGSSNFDEHLLDEIYSAIRNEELVLPAEHTGVIRDNYEWKQLLKRQRNAVFYEHADGESTIDSEIFARIWRPIVASLAYTYERTEHANVLARAVAGFAQSATVGAAFGMVHVLDSLVIILCKFTHLTDSVPGEEQSSEASRPSTRNTTTSTPSAMARVLKFGADGKAHLAARTLFGIIDSQAHMIQEGWRNVLDILLTLFHARLLDQRFTLVEGVGKTMISIEPPQRTSVTQSSSSILLLSLVFNLGVSSEEPRIQEHPHFKAARDCVADCDMWCIVTESKYMPPPVLQHLIHAIIDQSSALTTEIETTEWRNYSRLFFVELLFAIAIENRHRLFQFWSSIQKHVNELKALDEGCTLLRERCDFGISRIQAESDHIASRATA